MIDARQRMFVLIYFALFGSVGLYLALAYNVFAKQPGAGTLDPTLMYALGGVAAMIVLVTPFLRSRLMPPRRDAASLDEAEPSGTAVDAALAQLFAAQIVTWALCESIAILGLVLVVMSHEPRYYIEFSSVATVSFLIYRPSINVTRAVARAAVEPAQSRGDKPAE